MTKYGNDVRLFLNGNLQFSSLDEFRYHETLVASALSSIENPKRVLIMGGGDGLLARDILKYSSVETIDIVDIDSRVTDLARRNRFLLSINQGSMNSPKVNVINQDAFLFSFATKERYDAVLVDLVDPSNERLSKLYSRQFYQQVGNIIAPHGVMVTQATSSFFSPTAFHVIANTVKIRAAESPYCCLLYKYSFVW